MVKEFLSQRGVRVQERDVSSNAVYAQELRASGQMGVPVTVINREMVIGFDKDGLERLIAKNRGDGQRTSFGASVADAARMIPELGSDLTLGAYVGRVKPGSAAESLKIAPGDIIVELNKQKISNAADLERVVSGLGKGSRIWVIFIRNKQKIAAEGLY